MKKRVAKTQHDIETEDLPSASGFDSEFRCLGKRALTQRLPKTEDTAIQARGHRIHQALADFTFKDLNKSEARTASRIGYLEAEIVHEYSFEGAEVNFEQRFWDYDDALNKVWSGRVDRHDWQQDKRRLWINDNKSGWALGLPITDCWQVKSEAALLADLYDAQEVVTSLIHPHDAEAPYQVAIYNRDQLDEILDSTRFNVAQIQLPDQPRTPGPIQCRWCEAKSICPEYAKQQAALAQAIADEWEDEGFSAILRRSKKERGAHVHQLKEFMANCKRILDQYLELQRRDGDAIAGWALKRVYKRLITDEGEAIERVEERYGTDMAAKCTKFVLTAFEDELTKTMSKREALEVSERMFHGILKRKDPEYSLREARSI